MGRWDLLFGLFFYVFERGEGDGEFDGGCRVCGGLK